MTTLRLPFQYAQCEVSGSAPIAYSALRPMSTQMALEFEHPLPPLAEPWHGACRARGRGETGALSAALNLLRGKAAPEVEESVCFGTAGLVASPRLLNLHAQHLVADLGLLRAAAIRAHDDRIVLSRGRTLNLTFSAVRHVGGQEEFRVESVPVTTIRTGETHTMEETTVVEEMRFGQLHHFPTKMVLKTKSAGGSFFVERLEVLLLSANPEDLKGYFASQRAMVQMDAAG